ncbi:MAG: RnfABCDGE type electron transport complex subunit D [Firmicutes bacterium]|nr:RnfABCDGE type electron transport complex subunit D [Bacillota bacterium]
MEGTRLVLSPSPHVRDEDTTQKIMLTVAAALVPVWAAATYFFGFDSIRLVVASALAAMGSEALFLALRRKPITISDGSALVTGMLLGLSLPPSLPTWMAVFGAFVAIVVGKQVFGGLGYNPFNPALVGRAVLVASFATQMTTWTAPFTDAVTQATPLVSGTAGYSELFFGTVPGSLGETSALAILLGGIILFYRGVLDYRIPVGFIGTVVVFSLLFGQDVVYQLLGGSLLFGAVFMATDMVTSPITPVGRWVFGIGCGLILVVIRFWGSLPEGLTYSILLMNALTPLINRWTRPRIYGRGVKDA